MSLGEKKKKNQLPQKFCSNEIPEKKPFHYTRNYTTQITVVYEKGIIIYFIKTGVLCDDLQKIPVWCICCDGNLLYNHQFSLGEKYSLARESIKILCERKPKCVLAQFTSRLKPTGPVQKRWLRVLGQRKEEFNMVPYKLKYEHM